MTRQTSSGSTSCSRGLCTCSAWPARRARCRAGVWWPHTLKARRAQAADDRQERPSCNTKVTPPQSSPSQLFPPTWEGGPEMAYLLSKFHLRRTLFVRRVQGIMGDRGPRVTSSSNLLVKIRPQPHKQATPVPSALKDKGLNIASADINIAIYAAEAVKLYRPAFRPAFQARIATHV